MAERHLTREATIAALESRARQMEVRDFALSLRQLDRWLAGELATLPRPSLCRVLEAEFGHPVDRLLATSEARDATLALPAPPDTPVDQLVAEAASESARFARWADSLAIGELALTTLQLRIQQLATAYVHAPMLPIFRALTSLRDEVFELLAAPDPCQARDLYLFAGITCGLLAHASGNLGDFQAAHLQAYTALLCARHADHPTLAAWALTLRALQSEWGGQPATSLDYITKARHETERELQPSTVGVWACAIEGRARARLGDPVGAADAIRRAAECREAINDVPESRSFLDQLGGILTFPEPKQLFYAASAYRRVGDTEAAVHHAQAAIDAYVTGPPEQRSYGDEALARIDLAIAHTAGPKPDLAATAEALHPVVSLPPALHLPTLTASLNELKALVSAPQLMAAPEGPALLGDIGTVLSDCRPPHVMVPT